MHKILNIYRKINEVAVSGGINKVFGFLGIFLLLVVGSVTFLTSAQKVSAQSTGCSVLHTFYPTSINSGQSSTQIYSFANWDIEKYSYSWDCGGGRGGVLTSGTQVKTVASGDFFQVGKTTTCTVTATPKAGSGVAGCSASASLTVQAAAPTIYSCGGSIPTGATACSGTISTGLAVSKNWTEVSGCSQANSFCEYTKPAAPPPSGSGINCAVSPSSQSASQGGSATYSVRNNSTEGVWAGVFPKGGNVTVKVAGGYTDPHPRDDRGKIYLSSGASASFTVNAYAQDRDLRYPANPGSYEGSVTCAKTDPYEVLPVGTFQRVSFNFTVLDGGQTSCGLETVSTPNNYATVLQGQSKDFTFKYHGSAGGKVFFNVNQNIEGVTFSVSPSGAILKDGDTVRITALASYGAPIKSYYPAGQFAPRPLSYGCEIDGKKTNYDGYDFAVIQAGSTIFTGYEPDGPMQINITPSLAGLTVKKGDKLTFDVTLNNPGDYYGKTTMKVLDVPPGVNATLKMDSDYMSSRGSIRGTLTLDVVGRVPSGVNRLILKFDADNNYRQCKAGVDYLCFMRALYNDSKVYTISGSDSNYGNTNLPAVVNSVEPTILKRVKVMPGGIEQENMGFLLMNVHYGSTPFISADVRTSADDFCYPQDSGNCYGGGKAEKWYVSQIDLKDPLSPGFAQNKLWVMEDGDDIAGDDGGHHEPTAVGISRDGTISLGSHHQGLIKMSSTQSPPFNKMNVGTFESSEFFVVDSGADTFRVNANGRGGYFTKQNGYSIEEGSRLGSSYSVYKESSLPKNVPSITDQGSPIAPIRAIDGESSDSVVVLGNGGKNASSITGARIFSDIAIYSMERNFPLGTATLAGFSAYDMVSSLPYGFETPNGKYAFVAVRDKFAATSGYSADNERIQWASNRNFYLYKLDEVSKKLVPIIERAKLSEGGQVKDVTPVSVSGKDFLMVFTNKTVRTGDTSAQVNPAVAIYSIDELKTGKVRNIASNAISSMKQIRNAESLIKEGVTYVYTIDENGGFLIWKFDVQSLSGTGTSSGGGGGSSGGGSTGGGGGGGVTPPTYDCNFDLAFTPTNLTVKQGTYFASYSIKANSTSINPFCTISITPSNQPNIAPFLNSLVVSPGGQASMLFNVSKATKGSYTLPVKAATKGVPTKTYEVKLNIE